ncbi:hypothetical protein PoB_006542100 [Plakobranchus ocellatus]|uniref:Uncharacterized protein n=1 Tax=Plakobranchus ocellatus TaxID=259542 RepID=A0AAV4D489_9GAST|nr:hypothetical protein PoB_006542100 [Plakobranchus ocellatus]
MAIHRCCYTIALSSCPRGRKPPSLANIDDIDYVFTQETEKTCATRPKAESCEIDEYHYRYVLYTNMGNLSLFNRSWRTLYDLYSTVLSSIETLYST